jgi:Histidine kinase-like ATPase domain
MEMERLTIRIPPGTAHVASVRAFVGAVGRRLGCSEETIDDLRLAATEACAQAIEERVADDGVEVRTLSDDHRLFLEIDPSGSFDRPPDGLDGSTGSATRRALIEGLFPDAEFDREHAVLRIAVPVTQT